MPERLLIGPGSPPSLDPVYPELSPPLEPCPISGRRQDYHSKKDHHKRVTTERPHPTGGAPHPAGVGPPPGMTRKGEVDSDSLFRVFRWIPWLLSDPSGAAIGFCWTESAVRICADLGCRGTRKACFLSLLAQAAVWLLELRVSQHFSTFYGPSVQAMDTQLGGRHRRRTPANVERGAWGVGRNGRWSRLDSRVR